MAKRQRQVVATIRFPFLLHQRLRIGNRKQKCHRREREEREKKIYKDKLCWLLLNRKEPNYRFWRLAFSFQCALLHGWNETDRRLYIELNGEREREAIAYK